MLSFSMPFLTGVYPTYGELIDLFEKYEDQPNAEHLICSKVSERHPTICTKRSGRLFNSVQRIVAPTRTSLRGPAKISGGSPLSSYRRRVWQPRITRTVPPGTCTINFFNHTHTMFVYTILEQHNTRSM